MRAETNRAHPKSLSSPQSQIAAPSDSTPIVFDTPRRSESATPPLALEAASPLLTSIPTCTLPLPLPESRFPPSLPEFRLTPSLPESQFTPSSPNPSNTHILTDGIQVYASANSISLITQHTKVLDTGPHCNQSVILPCHLYLRRTIPLHLLIF